MKVSKAYFEKGGKEFERLGSQLEYVQEVAKSISRELTEEEVLRGLRDEDESMLGYVYSQYARTLFRYGHQFTTDKEIIMDAIHDVFVNLIAKKHLVTSVKAYLFTSLYHRVIYLLKDPNKPDLSTNSDESFQIAVDMEESLINTELQKEKMNQVRHALRKLSSKQRQAVLLYYSDGFTHKEIAGIMGLSNTNSISKLIARAIKAVRGNLLSISILLLVVLPNS